MRRWYIPLSLLALLGSISSCGGPVAPVASPSSAGSVEQVSPAASEPAASATTAPATPSPAATAEPTATTAATQAPPASEEPAATAEGPSALPSRPEPSLAATAGITELLGVEWATDSDGNAIPDAVEIAIGSDPLANDCPLQQCGDVPLGAAFFEGLNVMLLFDSSGSMAGTVDGERKIDIAKRAVEQYLRVGSIAANVGLLVYGHTGNNTEAGKPESCAGPEILAPLGQANDASAAELISRFEPTGWTPIGGALEKAQQAFAGKEGQINRIVIVSDGIETCEGDPVAVAKRLNSEGLKVVIDVIGFDLNEAGAVEQMQAVAAAGGGVFYDARTREDFQRFLLEQIGKVRDGAEARTCATQNLGQLAICGGQQYSKAVNYAYEQRLQETDPARQQAYDTIVKQIGDAGQRLQQASVESAQRAVEAQDQLTRLEQAVREAQENAP